MSLDDILFRAVFNAPGNRCTCLDCPIHREGFSHSLLNHPLIWRSQLAENAELSRLVDGLAAISTVPDTHCGLCGADYAGPTCPGCNGDIFGEPIEPADDAALEDSTTL